MKLSRLVILIALFSGIAFSANAQSEPVEPPKMRELKGEELQGTLKPLQNKKGLWGYVNSEDKFVIKAQFEDAKPYEGNVAQVRFNGKCGIIGRNGLYILPPTYMESLGEFSSDSVAIFRVQHKYGLVDTKGRFVQSVKYDDIQPKSFGYLACINLKYSTIDKKGNIICDKKFDSVSSLNEDESLDHVFMERKWGIIKNGKDVITHGWDKQLQLLYDMGGDSPDLYLVSRRNLYGVVTSDGKQVAPVYYDAIELHESGNYFITVRNGKYGAISLRMSEIVPPILDEKPVIEDKMYRVYDGFNFWCANVYGRLEFRVCADVYSARKPAEYVTTTEYPEWAKLDIIESNLEEYTTSQGNARTIYDVMVERSYNMDYIKHDPRLPKDVELTFPSNDVTKYGVLSGHSFIVGGGKIHISETDYLQIAMKSTNMPVYLASDQSGDKYYLYYDNKLVSLNDALDKFNVKSCPSLYPKDCVLMPDGKLLVRIAFVRSKDEANMSLIETDAYNLPVSNAHISLFTGTPNSAVETYGLLTMDIANSSALSFAQLPADMGNIIASTFGGFYGRTSQSVVADTSNPLTCYDRNGNLEWIFRAHANEVLVDIDETENYIYLGGYTKDGNVEHPLLIQLDKLGNRAETIIMSDKTSRFSAIKCANHLIYAKLGGNSESFYPHFILEDLGDNMYVRPCCVWEDWGGKHIGGCGLIAENGKWIQSPILEGEQMGDEMLYDWEFGSFSNDYLIIRKSGKYGIINRAGDMLVKPKYEQLEQLENPNYFRVLVDGMYGVIDATGRIIVPAEYNYIGRMSEDMIVAKRGRDYGCFDANGTNVVPFEFLEIKEYVGGMARIQGRNGRYGFIDKNGSDLVLTMFDSVEYYSEDLALVTAMGAVGFVDMQGNWVVRPIYDNGRSFSCGLAPVCSKNKWGYIDKSGDEKIALKFDSAEEFNKEYKIARVSKGGKWGVINDKGTDIVPISFDEVIICADGYIYVKRDDKCGVYSSKGDIVCPVECDDRGLYNSKSIMFKHGIAKVMLNGHSVKLDSFGNIISLYTDK